MQRFVLLLLCLRIRIASYDRYAFVPAEEAWQQAQLAD